MAELHLGQIYQLSQQRYPLQQDVAAAVEYYRRAALGGTVPWTVPHSLELPVVCSVKRLQESAESSCLRYRQGTGYFHCTPRLTTFFLFFFLANASRWLHPFLSVRK